MTPTQAAKALKAIDKKLRDDVTHRPPGTLALVDEDHKAPAYVPPNAAESRADTAARLEALKGSPG